MIQHCFLYLNNNNDSNCLIEDLKNDSSSKITKLLYPEPLIYKSGKVGVNENEITDY